MTGTSHAFWSSLHNVLYIKLKVVLVLLPSTDIIYLNKENYM